MKKFLVSLLLVIALVLGGCGNSSGPTSRAEPETHEAEGPPVPEGLWQNPLGDLGMKVNTPSQANLPFDPVEPGQTGPAEKIVATVENHGPPTERQIAWVFAFSGGDIFLQEGVVDYTEEALESQVQPAGCTTPSPVDGEGVAVECVDDVMSLVQLKNGAKAVLIQGPEVTSITWLRPLRAGSDNAFRGFDHPSIELELMGPADIFSGDQALDFANRV